MIYKSMFSFLILFMFILIGCERIGDEAQDDSREVIVINIENGKFNPESVTVTPGTEVRWENKDSKVHSIMAGEMPAMEFDSGTIEPGSSFSFTFNNAGNYNYRSVSGNESVSGLIVVKPEGE